MSCPVNINRSIFVSNTPQRAPVSDAFFMTHVTSKNRALMVKYLSIIKLKEEELLIPEYFWETSKKGNRAEQDRPDELNVKPINTGKYVFCHRLYKDQNGINTIKFNLKIQKI